MEESIYAICEFHGINSKTEDGVVKMNQYPGYAIASKIELSNLTPSTKYKIVINKYATIGDTCTDVGGEFNPLNEINQWGQANPHQDPSRGRFEEVAADGQGKVKKEQSALLQNMAGDESLIGRSMALMTGDETTPRACCVIARDIDPTAAVPTVCR